MKGITLCADCAYYNMKKHKCTRGCKIDPDISKGENPSFYVDCPLPDVEPSQKWIPCSERLPEVYEKVLTYNDEGIIHDNFRLNLIDGSVGWSQGWGITHWQPRPEPPEKEAYHEQSADNRA